MTIEQRPPDPARVAIVQRITHCTEQKAAKVIRKLDEHDTQQPPNTSNGENSGGYASLPDLLPVGKAALVSAGYDPEEAGYILSKLFAGLAAEHGGKRLYLPKADKITQRIQECL
ncbi:hypothetical protein [Thiothrix nivea]|uniref:Uncharacterized protein n=1 Tax=Thiothrix nivea (strain ATCC 35100 / DSM 5205 / JP2) TaxID=870187 RepID=A0A656HD39_THINJ|nr:hypothetical protein [Thiothrix nivea]EIJ33370.1 hypothetical protein Thini_0733 [Thiothrix nivea DSM 5205]